MPSSALFGVSVAFGLAVWGAVTWQDIWPALKERRGPESLKPILLLHAFRFLGLAFLVPGVVSPELPATFAQPVAYGNFITAILALLALGGGYINIPEWLAHAYPLAEHENVPVMVISAAFGIGGIALAWLLYVLKPSLVCNGIPLCCE